MLNGLLIRLLGLFSLITIGQWKTVTVPKHGPVDVIFTKRCKMKSIDSQKKEEVVKQTSVWV